MINITERSIPALLTQASGIKHGIAVYGESTQMKRHSVAEVSADFDALANASDAYEQSRIVMLTLKSDLRDNFAAARVFLGSARDVLRLVYGNFYTEQWDPTGFVGSLTIPSLQGDIVALIRAMSRFLAANPTLEHAGLNVTAARAQTLYNALDAGIGAVNAQRTQVQNLKAARDMAADQLRKRVRGVVMELRQVLDDLDPKWLAFGLNMPGAEETPEAPTNVSASLIAPNTASIKWDGPPRTEYHRVWKKVLNVDADFVAVGTPIDVDFTLEELPRNAQIQVAVSAVNNGGESELSEVITIMTQ
jgi:hypothetical protein